MTYFYARVSSKEQNLSRQLKAADDFGVDKVFSDKQSGKNFDRPAYQKMLSELKKGDLVVVMSLDRFGRNYDEISKEWEHITKNIGADICVMDMDALDTRQYHDLTGQLIAEIILKLLSYVAQTERDKIKTRQKEGIAAMKADGRWSEYGRPQKKITDFEIFFEKQKEGLLSVTECCKALNISRSTWYGRVRSKGDL